MLDVTHELTNRDVWGRADLRRQSKYRNLSNHLRIMADDLAQQFNARKTLSSIDQVILSGADVLLIVDLVRLLDVPPNEDIDPIYRHVIDLSQDDGSSGLLVDRVEDVASVPANAIIAADGATTVNDCVVGQVEIGGETVHVLDAERIFLAAERLRLADIQKSEQARLDALDA